MQETLKYIKVLNWGYGGFAPMTLTPDYKESLEQVKERLGLLDSLNYLTLLDEATSTKGKAWLDKYSKTGGFDFSLHFMRDREQLLDMLQSNVCKRDGDKLKYSENPNRMFGWAFEGIEKYLADKSWSKKQYNEYKLALRELEKALEDRLRQFAAAYDYPLSADEPEQAPEPQQGDREAQQEQPEPQQEKEEQANRVVLPEVLDTKRVKQIFGGAIAKGWMQPNGNNGYKWIGFGNRGQGQQLVYMCGQIFGYHKGISGNDGANIPSKELEKLFGISGFYSKLIKCWGATKPQTWRIPIDKMIEEVTKGT